VILFTVFDVFTTRMTATAIYSRVIEINKFNPGGILTTYFFYWSIVTELCAVHISAEKSALFFYSFIISQYMSADCWPTFLCRQQIRPINQPKMFADFSGLLSVPFVGREIAQCEQCPQGPTLNLWQFVNWFLRVCDCSQRRKKNKEKPKEEILFYSPRCSTGYTEIASGNKTAHNINMPSSVVSQLALRQRKSPPNQPKS